MSARVQLMLHEDGLKTITGKKMLKTSSPQLLAGDARERSFNIYSGQFCN